MVDFIQNILDGIANGSAYALLALGFTLIFGVLGSLNLAFGPSIMIGLYAAAFLYQRWGLPPLLLMPVAVGGAVVAGIYVERLCFAWSKPGAGLAAMVASFAIWMQLEEVATLVMPRHSYPLPALADGAMFGIGPFLLRGDYLGMLAIAALVTFALERLIRHSQFGLRLQAVAEAPRAARFMGIRIERVLLSAFILASAIGGIGGFLIVTAEQQLTPMFGMWATFKGLTAMMIGGLGSLPGAVVGGLLLGIIEAQAHWYGGAQIRELAAFLVLFLMLVLRPAGLLGASQAERLAAAHGRL
jgi:branched-chain amino acid transport system permease protein